MSKSITTVIYKWHDARDGSWKEATNPKRVPSPEGYEDFIFFIHKEFGLWAVTELESGANCGVRHHTNRADMLADFHHCLTVYCTPERLRQRVELAKRHLSRDDYNKAVIQAEISGYRNYTR